MLFDVRGALPERARAYCPRRGQRGGGRRYAATASELVAAALAGKALLHNQSRSVSGGYDHLPVAYGAGGNTGDYRAFCVDADRRLRPHQPGRRQGARAMRA